MSRHLYNRRVQADRNHRIPDWSGLNKQQLSAFLLFCRIKDAHDRYPTVQRHMPAFIAMGLTFPSRKLTAEGQALFRRLNRALLVTAYGHEQT